MPPATLPIAVKLRDASARVLASARGLPWRRSIGRSINELTLHWGAPQLAVAELSLGYRMRVDLRALSQRDAFFLGEYESELLSRAVALIPPNAVVLDVGANIGFYSVPFAQAVLRSGGHVHAFEPLPANAARLQENLAINRVTEAVTVWPMGLSNTEHNALLTKREDFQHGGGTGNCSVFIPGVDDERFAAESISLSSLDHLHQRGQLPHVDFAKVDIEGHEDLFLQGAVNTLSHCRPLLLMEVNKTYFERREVDLEARLREYLPRDYVWLRSSKALNRRWQPTQSLAPCSRLDNLFLVPQEHLERTLATLHGC